MRDSGLEEFTDLQIEFKNLEPFRKKEVYDFRQETIMAGHFAEIPMTRFYLRLGVKNVGTRIAKGCKGRLVRFGEVSDVSSKMKFQPVLLNWADSDSSSVEIGESEIKYLDLIYSDSERPNLLQVESGKGDPESNLKNLPRCDYSLEVLVTGENVKPKLKSFHLKILEDGYDRIELEELSGS
ncbi:MAG: hypothetical protein ACE5KG_01485 [Nitrososphaerales archaeon]